MAENKEKQEQEIKQTVLDGDDCEGVMVDYFPKYEGQEN